MWTKKRRRWNMFNYSMTHPYLTQRGDWNKGKCASLCTNRRGMLVDLARGSIYFFTSYKLQISSKLLPCRWRQIKCCLFISESSQMSCQNNMDVYWKRAEDRGIAYFKSFLYAAQSFGIEQLYVGESYCAVPLSALGFIAGSPASVDECEWMVNDRPRHCQSISRAVWPHSFTP